MRLYALFFILSTTFVVSLSLGIEHVDAVTCTEPGTRPATAEDAIVKNGVITAGTCYNPTDTTLGSAAEGAKEFLRQHATKNSNISCLNTDYATKLANLMKAVPGGVPTITDAYRSPQDQEKAKASGASQVGACGSYHQFGLAADFNNADKNTLLWMRIHAPEYGLTRIPAMSILTGCSLKGTGFCDPAHIQINNALPSRDQCGVCATTGGYGILPGVPVSGTPDDIQPGIYSPATGAPMSLPSAGFVNNTPSPASTATANQTQPQICTPEFSCTNNTMYYKTTSCTSQIYQTCPYGCNGNTCNLSTSTAQTSTSLGSAFATSTNTNDNTNTNDTTTTGGSISDFLNSYINPTAVEIGTSSSVAFRLNPETGDIEQIPQTTGSGLSSSTNVITSVQPIAGQQTFTSGDLSGSYSSFSGTQQSSVLQKVLEGMKSALLWAVNALRSL